MQKCSVHFCMITAGMSLLHDHCGVTARGRTPRSGSRRAGPRWKVAEQQVTGLEFGAVQHRPLGPRTLTPCPGGSGSPRCRRVPSHRPRAAAVDFDLHPADRDQPARLDVDRGHLAAGPQFAEVVGAAVRAQRVRHDRAGVDLNGRVGMYGNGCVSLTHSTMPWRKSRPECPRPGGSSAGVDTGALAHADVGHLGDGQLDQVDRPGAWSAALSAVASPTAAGAIITPSDEARGRRR